MPEHQSCWQRMQVPFSRYSPCCRSKGSKYASCLILCMTLKPCYQATLALMIPGVECFLTMWCGQCDKWLGCSTCSCPLASRQQISPCSAGGRHSQAAVSSAAPPAAGCCQHAHAAGVPAAASRKTVRTRHPGRRQVSLGSCNLIARCHHAVVLHAIAPDAPLSALV